MTTLETTGAQAQGDPMYESTQGAPQDAELVAMPLVPERRGAAQVPAAWLTRMLDEVDYGMLLVAADARVVYLNHAARLELDGRHPLLLSERLLGAHKPPDALLLAEALAEAQRGLRRLLSLGSGLQQVCISVVPLQDFPLATDGSAEAALTLLVLGKRQVCEQLSVQAYARSCQLTPAETRVLEGLCGGLRPGDIAADAGVAVSTVRTQIGSLRAKTGAGSIRELVHQVAVLPPLVGALRSAAGMPQRTASTGPPARRAAGQLESAA
jgi:DNA-binding CsgD family transcriptional regulator